MTMCRVYTLLLFATVCFVFTPPLRAQCPPAAKVSDGTLSCIANFTRVTKAPIKGSKFKNYCDNQAVSELKCLENMYNDCEKENPAVRQILDKTTNLTAVRTAIRTMCDNSGTLVAKQQCLTNEQSFVTKCNMVAMDELQETMNPPQNDPHANERRDNATCTYTRQLFACQKRYGDKCGKDVLDILDKVMEAINPPGCGKLPPRDDKESSESSTNDSVVSHNAITGYLCVVAIVSYFSHF